MACSSMAAATASMISLDPSAPVLAARTSKSSATAAICWVMSSVESSSTARTPTVFWAVTSVRALVP